MDLDRDNRRRRPLVTVGSHSETDIATGETERQLFVKMYFEARDSGLLASIPDRLWKMLCVLATYIDQNGNCFPSQSRIAKDLGIHRQRVNERIQELLDFRFQGVPVISISKNRDKRSDGGGTKWANNVYRLYPISGFQIFDQKPEGNPQSASENPYVRKSGHTPVSEDPDIRNPDTNKIHVFNQTNTRVDGFARQGTEPASAACQLVRYFHEAAGHPTTQKPLAKEFKQAADLIAEHGEETARWIVEFALQKAPETNFRPRHLGAVLSFVSEALIAREGYLAAERRREERDREERQREKQLEVERAALAALLPEERLERDLERWRMFFPALHKNREPTVLEVEAKRRELASQHSLTIDDGVTADPESLTA